MSRDNRSRVLLASEGQRIILAMARARNEALERGERVWGFEVDADTDAALTAAHEQYRRNTAPTGREVLNLPVRLGAGPGWRVVVRAP